MANVDKENMVSVLDNFWKQCKEASMMGKEIKVSLPVNGIILCGMGGSAIPGDIIMSDIDPSVPFAVNRSYDLPKWVNKNTLVFVVSYSGNTEETLSCFKAARARQCKMVGISAGGKLQQMCEQASVPFIKVPSGIQPRDASGYMTLPMLNVLQNSRIIKDCRADMEEMIDALGKDYREKAQEIAKKLVGKIPVIYSSHRLISIARVWKIKINENAKVQAFYNEFPEMNHNEMVGYTDLKGNFFIIIIEDEKDHLRIRKRMAITSELLKSKGCPVMAVKIKGDNVLSKIFSTILLGSYVGYYLALEYGTDPSPVVMVENLKKEMGPFS